MALFDKDNPGKNLANATLWLEASRDSDGGGESSGGSSGGVGGCMAVVFVMIGLCLMGGILLTCASYVFLG